MQGPIHPQLGIAMDMSVQMKVASGAVCTLALSFNNEGPLGTFFRYICDNGTYIARYDELIDGADKPIDVSKVDVSMVALSCRIANSSRLFRSGANRSPASNRFCRRCALWIGWKKRSSEQTHF